MAVYSMTGFGNASATAASAASTEGAAPAAPADSAAVTVELRSVNSRFLDLAFRMPDELRQREGALRELVSAACRRGKVDPGSGATRCTKSTGSSSNSTARQRIPRSVGTATWRETTR